VAFLKRLLAVDCSTWWGSVALIEESDDGPSLICDEGARVERSHSVEILDWVDRALARAGWNKSQLDAFAATRGPGSFTGIRVGLGTVRGLSVATGKPVIGVTTLASIADAVGPSANNRQPVMDAGRGELYTAVFDAAGRPPAVCSEPHLGDVETLLDEARRKGHRLVAGPGSDFPSVEPGPVRLAGACGRIAMHELLDETVEASSLAPLYIRAPDALLKPRGS
jgi:tRNA threonylcarbamoyladenosine biosynthesis protein TsaB